jgi:hypothetical protein
MNRPYSSLAGVVVFFLLFGCAKTTTTTKTPVASVSSSRSSGPSRPGAPLGLFTSYYLGGGGISPSNAALSGVAAQVKLNAEYNPMKSDDTFALLQEFGDILQISIPDLLNRSSDRPTTLTEYTNALSNITARSTTMAKDLTTHLTELRTTESTQKSLANDTQKKIDAATKSGDFATAGSLQQTLIDAQSGVTQAQVEERETQNTLQTYQKLIIVANQRLNAINTNREILISGLKVVDMPGIEGLGIVTDHSSSSALFQR